MIKTEKVLSKEKAKALVDAYEEHRVGKEPYPMPSPQGQTKWVWFNMETLQAVLDIISRDYAGHDPSKVGIKFYFGKYKDVPSRPDLENHITLVMTPAEKVVYGGIEIIKDHTLGLEIDQEVENSLQAGDSEQAFFNWGNLCPPTCEDPPKGGGFSF